MPGIRELAVRWVMGGAVAALYAVLTCYWFVRRPVTFGVRAIPVTPEGRIVLIRHTYVRGWHLPGGGRSRHESPEAACLRELREEIGMTTHASVRFLGDLRGRPTFKRDSVALFVVEDVRFAPRWSLEIEAVEAFAPDQLPEGTTPATHRRIAEWLAGQAPPADW